MGYPGAPRCFCAAAAANNRPPRFGCMSRASGGEAPMRCPYCGGENTQVKDSRPTEENAAIRRRRVCPDCGGRFTTFERVQLREIARRQALGPQGAVRPRQAVALGRDRAAQAPDRARAHRAHGVGHRAPARKRGRERDRRPRRSASSSWRPCAGSTPSPTCASPPSIAISARRPTSTRCWARLPPSRPPAHEAAHIAFESSVVETAPLKKH